MLTSRLAGVRPFNVEPRIGLIGGRVEVECGNRSTEMSNALDTLDLYIAIMKVPTYYGRSCVVRDYFVNMMIMVM